jgi:alpha-L-arabinofuranosidase
MVLRIANVKFTSPAPVPANPTIRINASHAIRTADVRWFGINTGIWDTNFTIAKTVPELNEAGFRTLRFPGGSAADNYHWSRYITWPVSANNPDWQGFNPFPAGFATVATNIGATAIITVNYGTGTPDEAAAWVRYSNVTNHYGFKYWEIGNEVYGSGETDNNPNPHDPYTYATRAATYVQQMKSADPTIKIGVVVVKGLQTASNGYTNHPATNLVTGQVFYGWTPVVLSTLRQLGVTPDFAIYHWYPQYDPYVPDNDQTLLAGTGNWAGDAAELRAEINDFFGPGGTNIELLVTENNSEGGTYGKQSVSLVNGLYYADSLGQLMKTEFNALVW